MNQLFEFAFFHELSKVDYIGFTALYQKKDKDSSSQSTVGLKSWPWFISKHLSTQDPHHYYVPLQKLDSNRGWETRIWTFPYRPTTTKSRALKDIAQLFPNRIPLFESLVHIQEHPKPHR